MIHFLLIPLESIKKNGPEDPCWLCPLEIHDDIAGGWFCAWDGAEVSPKRANVLCTATELRP